MLLYLCHSATVLSAVYRLAAFRGICFSCRLIELSPVRCISVSLCLFQNGGLSSPGRTVGSSRPSTALKTARNLSVVMFIGLLFVMVSCKYCQLCGNLASFLVVSMHHKTPVPDTGPFQFLVTNDVWVIMGADDECQWFQTFAVIFHWVIKGIFQGCGAWLTSSSTM